MNAMLQQGFPLLLAQEEIPDEVAMTVGLAFFAGILCIGIAIHVLLLYLLYNAYRVVPTQYQAIEPWQVFLMLIPCFHFVWAFIVYQRIPESFQRCMYALGRNDQGDCGQQLGLWYAICLVCAAVPYIGAIPGIAALVLWIIFVVKMYELKRIVEPNLTKLQSPQPAGGTYTGDPSNPYSPPSGPPGQSPFGS